MMFFIFIKYEAFYRLISRYVFYLIYVLTFIVIAYRSYLCIKKTKSHFIKVDEEIIGGNKNENRNCI